MLKLKYLLLGLVIGGLILFGFNLPFPSQSKALAKQPGSEMPAPVPDIKPFHERYDEYNPSYFLPISSTKTIIKNHYKKEKKYKDKFNEKLKKVVIFPIVT